MPRYQVYLGKEIAFDATVEVEAKSEDEAVEAALNIVSRSDFEEGDWESVTRVEDVFELHENDGG